VRKRNFRKTVGVALAATGWTEERRGDDGEERSEWQRQDKSETEMS
jgi:hypothetical protein